VITPKQPFEAGDQSMSLIFVALAIGLLIVLIAWGRFQPFLAFIIASLAAALMLGLPVASIPKTIEHGIGDMLGSLSVIICFGAMFGKLVADSGAAQKIAQSLIGLFGLPLITLAMTVTGFVVGIPLFYNVGFVVLVPLVFSVVYQSKLPAVYLGIPLLAGLSIAHGFLPPHPSPTALVTQFGANMGLTLIYGLIVGIPTLLIAGPLFAQTLKGIKSTSPSMFLPSEAPPERLPSGVNSFLTALTPVFLIAATTIITYLPNLDPTVKNIAAFLAQPMIVMLLAVLTATVTLGLTQGTRLEAIMTSYGSAIKDIAAILLIVAGAGALKQVLIDSGVSAELGLWLKDIPVPPLVLGWLIAMVIRIALGSATVAGLTAAGIVAPLIIASGVNPNLMVLAIGAGSLMCSHVNDSGFWMFKEYFNLSLKDTFLSWSVMETLVGIFGLIFILVLNHFI
jgi:gluconate transporter